MESKMLYVVTAGTYSDYHICGVFDDEKLAQRLADHLRDDSGRVEEWPLNHGGEHLRQGVTPFTITLYDNGEVSVSHDDFGAGASREQGVVGESTWYNGVYWFAAVLARDEEHAKKIAFDKIAIYRAHKAGMT